MADEGPERRRGSPVRRGLVVATGLLAAATVVGLLPDGLRRVEEERCLRRLDSARGEEREATIRRLGELRSARAVPQLVEIAMGVEAIMSWDADDEPAAQALVAIGPAAVGPLLDHLVPVSVALNERVREICCRLGPESLLPLLTASRHEDEHRRCFAVGLLAKVAAADPRTFDALIHALRDPSECVRKAAVGGLSKARHRASEALTHLIGRLEDPAEATRVRWVAAFDLPSLGDPGIHALCERLSHDDELVRAHVADSLLSHSPELKEKCVRVVEDCLEAPDPRARRHAIFALNAARVVRIELLPRFLSDPDAGVRSEAVQILAGTNAAPDAVPALIRILREQPEDRSATAAILERLGPRARDALPDLMAVLEEDDFNRASILSALESIGPDAKVALPALTRALATECSPAARALGSIGPDAVTAAPALVAALSSPGCSREVVEALVRIGPGVVPALIPVLDDDSVDGYALRDAVSILEELGPAAAAATGALAQLAADP